MQGRRAPRISLSDTTPPAPDGYTNVKWQSDALGNRSGYVPEGGEGGGSVSDTAYGASWDGETTTAPSQNAVYDKIESIGVGGGGAWTLIDRQVLGSDVASVTFSSISGAYNHLKLIITGRDTSNNSPICPTSMQFNNDTGANYDRQYLLGTVNTVSADDLLAQTSMSAGALPGTAAVRANARGQIEILIPDYATTVFEKSAMVTWCAPGAAVYVAIDAQWWRNTAAITEIDLLALANFKTGSIFSLYGIT